MIRMETSNIRQGVGIVYNLKPALKISYFVDRVKFVLNGEGMRLVAKPLNIKQMKQNKGV